jgi:hypothetical protein
VLPLSSSFSSYSFLMNILIFYLASTLFFFQISTLCSHPSINVGTLTLGLWPRQGLAKVQAKNGSWESHFILLGV